MYTGSGLLSGFFGYWSKANERYTGSRAKTQALSVSACEFTVVISSFKFISERRPVYQNFWSFRKRFARTFQMLSSVQINEEYFEKTRYWSSERMDLKAQFTTSYWYSRNSTYHWPYSKVNHHWSQNFHTRPNSLSQDLDSFYMRMNQWTKNSAENWV